MTHQIERVRRRGGFLERQPESERRICHHWRDETRRADEPGEDERERQSEGTERENIKGDEEEFRGHNNDKMTRG